MSNAAARKPAGPPPPKRLRRSGTTMVLKPLAPSKDLANREAIRGDWLYRSATKPAAYRLSWYHRSLAIGGAFSLVAIFLGIGIHIGVYYPSDRPAGSLSEVAVDQLPEAFPYMPTEQDAAWPQDETSFTTIPYSPRTVRSAVKQRTARARAIQVAYRRPRLVRRPTFVVSRFVPTRLIIYPENGKIVMRIEPQLTSRHKSSGTLPSG